MEGKKFDTGKRRWDLVPPAALDAVVEIYDFGAAKYADRNWELGINYGRVFAACMRHLWAFWRGEELDPESGKPHLAHAAWNCLALLHFEQNKEKYGGFDDRKNT